MKSIKHHLNTALLIGILVFLFIPLLQNQFQFKKNIKPLRGAYVEANDTALTVDTWFSGRYRELKDNFLTQHFGLRNYYVMLNNQINYKLFNVANIKKVIIGKGDFLFETDYIDAYYGTNFVGLNELTDRYKKVKELQQKLASMGIALEIVFLPSKASFYPEFIPEENITEKKLSNYECATALCKKLNINHVDFSAWFKQMKYVTPYDLYPKTGIHWSNYGALIATDSLKKHIEQTTHYNLRDFVITDVVYSDSLINPDNDMGEVMNLLFDIKTLPMPYANYYWKEDNENTVRPKTIVIADSYYWNIYQQGLSNNLFTDNKYWYYNQTVYPESEAVREVSKLDLLAEIKKQQVIILMATEINVHDIGWGFVDKALEVLKSKTINSFQMDVYVKSISGVIKQNKQWMIDITRKAAERNISIDEMVKLDAIYVYETEYSAPDVAEKISTTKNKIMATPEWMEQIKIKAKTNNVSIEEMIELDAKYIYDTEIKKK